MATTPSRVRSAGPRLRRAASCLAALACASALRPPTDADTVAGARALDTSYRVKEPLTVPGRDSREYVLLVGEYRPKHVDGDGILYASPLGITERAGFSKRVVPGGLHVASEPGQPFVRPSLWVELGGGRISKLPLPDSVLRRYGDALAFAVNREELIP